MKLEKFAAPKCLKCGGDSEVYLDDDGGCSDPECCGGPSYHAAIKCPNCLIEETIY